MGIMDQIQGMPSQVASFAKDVPERLGKLPGRMMTGMSNVTGTHAPNMPREMMATGINPRRQYWADSLSDLSNIAGRRGDPNSRGKGRMLQTQHEQEMANKVWQKKYQAQMAEAAMLNAGKRPDGRTSAMKNAEAMGFKPGTTEYTEMVRKMSMKPGVAINMGPEVTQEFYSDIAKGLPAMRSNAELAQQDIARYKALESLLPHIGESGLGKDTMVSFKSALNNFGMGGAATFMDALGEAAGVDFFSGDQGAAELFRALSSEDIVGQAKQLYPVSNSDINLLREMVASLRINDKGAIEALIGRGLQQAQIPIDTFNRNRQYMESMESYGQPGGFPAIPGLRANPNIDVRGVTNDDDEWERSMIEEFGADWRTK